MDRPLEYENWTNEHLLKGYLIVNGSFQSPNFVKFPSIGSFVDKTTTVYPIFGDVC